MRLSSKKQARSNDTHSLEGEAGGKKAMMMVGEASNPLRVWLSSGCLIHTQYTHHTYYTEECFKHRPPLVLVGLPAFVIAAVSVSQLCGYSLPPLPSHHPPPQSAWSTTTITRTGIHSTSSTSSSYGGRPARWRRSQR